MELVDLFKYMLEHTSDSIYFKDRDCRFIIVSRKLAERFGLDKADKIIGRTDFDFFTEVHAREAFEDEQEIIRSGVPLIGKEELETWPNGSETWVLTEKIPLRDQRGEITGIFGVSKDITKQKLAEFAQQRSEAQLREHLREVEQNLLRAQVVQQAMLPADKQPHKRMRFEYYYRPVASVSGDILSLLPGRKDGVGVFIGDLAGHGLSAALFMSLVYFLSDRLFDLYAQAPEHLLSRMNDELQSLMKNSFMTALYGFIELPESNAEARLTCATAAHLFPIHYSSDDKRAQIIPLSSASCIGILPELQCKQSSVPLHTGDRIFFLTDGITEATNSSDVMFGEERLRAVIQKTAKLDLNANVKAVIDEVSHFQNGGDFIDDATLLAVEIL